MVKTGLSRSQWTGFLAAAIGYVFEGYDFVLISLAMPNIREEFSLTLSSSGALISAMFIARWFGGGITGWVGDKYGRRIGMAVSIVLYAGGTMASGFAWNYWSLFACRVLVGLGLAGEYAIASSYVLENWPSNWKNRASAFFIASFYVGSACAALVYLPIVSHFGWRMLFFSGGIPILLAVFMRRGIPESREWANAKQNLTGKKRGIIADAIHALSWRHFILLVLFSFGTFICTQTIKSFMPLYLSSIGHTPASVSRFMSLFSLTTFVGIIVVGIVAERVGTVKTIFVQYSIGIASVYLFVANPHASNLTFCLILILMGVSVQTAGALVPLQVSHYMSAQVRCTLFGVIFNLGALGGSFGTTIAGRLADSLGISPALGLVAGPTLIGLVIIVQTLRKISISINGELARQI